MSGPFRTYADTVAAAVGNPPALAALQQAGTAVDDALDAPEELEASLRQWRAAGDGVRRELLAYLMGGVPLSELPSLDALDRWNSPIGVEVDARLGPLSIHAHSPTVSLADPRPPGGPLAVGPLPPDAFAARLDIPVLKASGAVRRMPDGVAGLLSADLGVVEAAALASLRSVAGGPSLMMVFAAGFTPGLQIGFGFQISRLGGLFGINRGIDQPSITRRVRDGSATEVLFPLDVGAAAARALVALEEIFPPRPGGVVLGPTARLAWLEISGTGFFSLDLAVLLELPGPQSVVVAGVARAGLPGILTIRIDIVGGVDVGRRLVWVDASLVDSGALGIFSIYGDAAFRMHWGPGAYTVVSIGGFFPGFRPEPAQIPPMRRLGFALDSPVPGLKLRAEGYLAVTSNTIQLGGYFEAGIEAAGCGASGFLGVDAIVQFTPFHVRAEIRAGFRVKVFGLTFCGIAFSGSIDAPGPVVIAGRLTVETFLKDFHFDETFTIGESRPQPPVPVRRATAVLAAECFGPTSLRAVGDTDRSVTPAPRSVPQGTALVWPLGAVEWTQQRLPLKVPVDRLDGAPLGSMQQVTASAPGMSGDVGDLFAPGSFITLKGSAEQLNRPAYEDLPAGIRVGGTARDHGSEAARPPKHKVYRKVSGEVDWEEIAHELTSLGLPGILSGRHADPALPAVAATLTPQITAVAPAWVSSHDGASHASATAAHQAVRRSGSATAYAVAEADAARPVALAGV